MPKMVCTNCNVELRPERNGVNVKELFKNGTVYKIWRADLWKCPGCGIEVVAGFAIRPFLEQGAPDFQAILKKVDEGPDPIYEDMEL